jgi:predicted ester cyclase
MKKLFALSSLLLFIVFICSSCQEERTYTDLEKINPLLDKYIEAWNTGDLSLLTGVVDSSFELRKIPDFGPMRGIKTLEDYLTGTRKVVPDFFLKETDKLFISDTAIVVTWKFTGTYKGENDLPPTGSKLDIPGFSIIYFNGGKLTGEWIAFSDLTWAQQLGFQLLPPSTKQ